MRRYVLTNEALLELDDIWEYIARDDADAACRWITKLLDACELLAKNPHVGHSHAEISDKSILSWSVGNYLIFYRVFEEHIEVVGVIEGHRDVPSYLRRRS